MFYKIQGIMMKSNLNSSGIKAENAFPIHLSLSQKMDVVLSFLW